MGIFSIITGAVRSSFHFLGHSASRLLRVLGLRDKHKHLIPYNAPSFLAKTMPVGQPMLSNCRMPSEGVCKTCSRLTPVSFFSMLEGDKAKRYFCGDDDGKIVTISFMKCRVEFRGDVEYQPDEEDTCVFFRKKLNGSEFHVTILEVWVADDTDNKLKKFFSKIVIDDL